MDWKKIVVLLTLNTLAAILVPNLVGDILIKGVPLWFPLQITFIIAYTPIFSEVQRMWRQTQ